MKKFLPILILFFAIPSYVFSQGTLTNFTFFSNSLETNRNVQIYLPEGYNPGDSTRYPVIYLLHGASGDHNSFPWLKNILDTLIGNNYISPVIVVKPDGSTEYWGVSMFTNSELYGNFEDYIVSDLVEFIDSAYKTITNREKRAIWGASMGGFGSIKLALKYPDIYCAAASHSGPLDFSHLVDWVPAILNENGGPPVNNYIPTFDTFTWLFYICAGAFSPNMTNPPYYVDFPLDSMGIFIDSVFNRWQLHNPVKLAANLPSNTDLAIYFDCGMQDEVLLYPFNTGFADSLDLLGIDYVFESFNGTHTSASLSRVPIALMFLDSVMNSTGTNIEPGEVSGIWTKANSPYNINGEITIPNDSTLTIEPGVLVEFQGHYKFNVQGRLLAIGTETDTIVFTINDTTGFHHLTLPGGGWHGIKILDVASSNDSTILEYCTFQYGKANTGSGIVNRSGGAINTNLDKLRISHCLFRNNKSYSTDTWEGTSGAILIAGNGIIENCEFSWNESSWGSAMCVGGNTTGAIIRNNHFHHNTGHGTVNIALDAYPIFINNIIEYNHSYGEPSTPHGHGILHFSNNNNAGYAKIINNTIVNNTNVGEGGGIFVRDGNPTFINNIVYGNEPSQVNFLWASSVGFYNCLVEGGLAGFTGAAFTGTYENCTDVDPLFVSSNDYHLQDSSPCIGAAIDSVQNGSTMCYCPPNDFEGNPRPNPLGSMPDIGAFENQYGIPTDINDQKNQLPTKFKLSQNFPNPFNPTTTIKYSIPKMSFVTIKIYDVLGSEVTTLVNEEKSTGTYEIEFKGHSDEGQNLTSGVYLYKLSAGNYVETKKMILLK